MPNGNGMGPMGYGPMSGRGAGYCVGYEMPGCMNNGVGRGFGGGRGRRNMFRAAGQFGSQRGMMRQAFNVSGEIGTPFSPRQQMVRRRDALKQELVALDSAIAQMEGSETE